MKSVEAVYPFQLVSLDTGVIRTGMIRSSVLLWPWIASPAGLRFEY